MQAVLLAAGESSRMRPLTNHGHKSMIKLLGKPLIEHTIVALKSKDIKDIIIVVSPDSTVESYLGNGSKLGVSIKYVNQETAEGVGNALLSAKDLLEDKFLLMNAYHMEAGEFVDELLEKNRFDSVLLVKNREDASEYGLIDTDGDRVIEVTEKPKDASGLCIIGIYLLSKNFIPVLENTPEEHYQFEAALNAYAKEKEVGYVETDKETLVLKYPWHLLSIKNYLLANIKSHRGQNVDIKDGSQIIGEVYLDDGVTVLEGAVIKGPAYIGKNSYVGSNALLRDGVDLEEGAAAGSYMELKNVIVGPGSKTHSGFIGDSILGESIKCGGAVTTTNVRLDRANIKSKVKGEEVDTGLRHFGCVIGSGTVLGGSVTIMPGIIIGENCVIGPSTTVLSNVEDDHKYYTKFQEIVSK